MAKLIFKSREEAMAALRFVEDETEKADETLRKVSEVTGKEWLNYLIGLVILFGVYGIIYLLKLDMQNPVVFFVGCVAFIAAVFFGYKTLCKTFGLKWLDACWPRSNKFASGAMSVYAAGLGMAIGAAVGLGGLGGFFAAVGGIVWKPVFCMVKFMLALIIPPMYLAYIKSKAKSQKKTLNKVKKVAEAELADYTAA